MCSKFRVIRAAPETGHSSAHSLPIGHPDNWRETPSVFQVLSPSVSLLFRHDNFSYRDSNPKKSRESGCNSEIFNGAAGKRFSEFKQRTHTHTQVCYTHVSERTVEFTALHRTHAAVREVEFLRSRVNRQTAQSHEALTDDLPHAPTPQWWPHYTHLPLTPVSPKHQTGEEGDREGGFFMKKRKEKERVMLWNSSLIKEEGLLKSFTCV